MATDPASAHTTKFCPHLRTHQPRISYSSQSTNLVPLTSHAYRTLHTPCISYSSPATHFVLLTSHALRTPSPRITYPSPATQLVLLAVNESRPHHQPQYSLVLITSHATRTRTPPPSTHLILILSQATHLVLVPSHAFGGRSRGLGRCQ